MLRNPEESDLEESRMISEAMYDEMLRKDLDFDNCLTAACLLVLNLCHDNQDIKIVDFKKLLICMNDKFIEWRTK